MQNGNVILEIVHIQNIISNSINICNKQKHVTNECSHIGDTTFTIVWTTIKNTKTSTTFNTKFSTFI